MEARSDSRTRGRLLLIGGILLAVLAVLSYRVFILGPPLPRNPDGSVDAPRFVETLKKRWEPSLLPVARVELKAETGGSDLGSKLLGSFYLPKDAEIPKDHAERPMVLLAQINFAEVPPIEGYPEKGILQFFICAHSDVFGTQWLGFEGEEFGYDNFEVRFYPEPKEDPAARVTDFSFLPDLSKASENEIYLPLLQECSLSFEAGEEAVTPDDYRFEKYFGDYQFFERWKKNEWDAYDGYAQLHSGMGHKIGGYAGFTQEDPRIYQKPGSPELILLFQLDSDSGVDLMWGDLGIANFFIRPEDLAKRDFSRVIYNWDCG